MKLRNKKTGEIMDDVQYRNYSLSDGFGFRMNGKEWEYHSLAELNEDWEDYEEPKDFYYINENGGILKYTPSDPDGEDKVYMKYQDAIGNRFESEEEAEKAVEKLKAWKRLKDKGFEFRGWNTNLCELYFVVPDSFFPIEDYRGHGITEETWNDLDLLFGVQA